MPVRNTTHLFQSQSRPVSSQAHQNQDSQSDNHTLSPSPLPNESKETSELPPPPDGGWTAWLQVVAGHLVVFSSWGYIISFGIFQPYYERTLHSSPSAISWIGSVQICGIYGVGTFSGRAFDAGYYRTVLFAGLFLQLVGIFMTSIAKEYWQVFLAQGICQGLGCGLVFAPTIANMSTYFTTNRMLALSSAACGGATGGMVFPLIAQQLLPRIGFQWTVRVMGLVVLVSAVIIMALVRTRLPPRKAGALVDWAAFKDLTYVFYAISMFFTLWATFFAYYYARTYALDRLGGSQSTSFTMLLLINAVGIPGRLVPAYLADKHFGAINAFIPILIGAAACQYGWIGVEALTGDFAWVAIYGFFGAAIQGMFPATLAGLTSDLSKRGTRIGMVFSIVSIATLTGPPLAGKLIELCNGSYLAAQIWGGSCLALGTGLLLAARWDSRKKERGS